MEGHCIWREVERIFNGFRPVCGTCSDSQTVPPLRAERSVATLRFARKQGVLREGEREKTDYGLRATRKPYTFWTLLGMFHPRTDARVLSDPASKPPPCKTRYVPAVGPVGFSEGLEA
jgi:hypothetical protein